MATKQGPPLSTFRPTPMSRNPSSCRYTPAELRHIGLPRVETPGVYAGSLCTVHVEPTPSMHFGLCVLATPDLVGRPLPGQASDLQTRYSRRLHQASLGTELSPLVPCAREKITAVVWESDGSLSPELSTRAPSDASPSSSPEVPVVKRARASCSPEAGRSARTPGADAASDARAPGSEPYHVSERARAPSEPSGPAREGES